MAWIGTGSGVYARTDDCSRINEGDHAPIDFGNEGQRPGGRPRCRHRVVGGHGMGMTRCDRRHGTRGYHNAVMLPHLFENTGKGDISAKVGDRTLQT